MNRSVSRFLRRYTRLFSKPELFQINYKRLKNYWNSLPETTRELEKQKMLRDIADKLEA
jgi:hypothetical protein